MDDLLEGTQEMYIRPPVLTMRPFSLPVDVGDNRRGRFAALRANGGTEKKKEKGGDDKTHNDIS